MSAIALNAVLISDSPAPTDAELIERFVVARDQPAFAELVRRHSAVVLGVCRRVLHDPYDIDDVFQATFLVLVRDASRVRKRQSLASWLYGVAYRTSLRVARNKLRRRETILVDATVIVDDTLEKMTDRHDQQLVDIELNALPERYRQPLVMRYLSGQSVDQIATELGTTVGAVDGLLKRGKDLLRRRLLQRGITLGLALAAIQMTQQAAQAVASESLIESAIQAGLAWNGQPDINPPDVVSDRAVELAAKEVIAMTTTTKTALAVGLTLGGLVIGMSGASLYLQRGEGDAQAPPLVATTSLSGRARESLESATLTADPVIQVRQETSSDMVHQTTSLVVDGENGSQIVVGDMGTDKEKFDSMMAPIVKLDFTKRGPNASRLEAILREPTEMAFHDATLVDALKFLKQRHRFDIVIDSKALEDAGVTAEETQVNLVLSGISLKSGLQLLLEPLKLDYLIDEDVVKVTSRERACQALETRVYNVGLLPKYSSNELMDIILLTVEPESWNVASSSRSLLQDKTDSQFRQEAERSTVHRNGANPVGQGSSEAETDLRLGVIRASEKLLVIRQNQRNHDRIAELLNQLRLTDDAQKSNLSFER